MVKFGPPPHFSGLVGGLVLSLLNETNEQNYDIYLTRKINLRLCFIIVYIVMEYLGKGSLLNILQSSKDSIGRLQLFMFARDIASGMEYLASKEVTSWFLVF